MIGRDKVRWSVLGLIVAAGACDSGGTNNNGNNNNNNNKPLPKATIQINVKTTAVEHMTAIINSPEFAAEFPNLVGNVTVHEAANGDDSGYSRMKPCLNSTTNDYSCFGDIEFIEVQVAHVLHSGFFYDLKDPKYGFNFADYVPASQVSATSSNGVFGVAFDSPVASSMYRFDIAKKALKQIWNKPDLTDEAVVAFMNSVTWDELITTFADSGVALKNTDDATKDMNALNHGWRLYPTHAQPIITTLGEHMAPWIANNALNPEMIPYIKKYIALHLRLMRGKSQLTGPATTDEQVKQLRNDSYLAGARDPNAVMADAANTAACAAHGTDMAACSADKANNCFMVGSGTSAACKSRMFPGTEGVSAGRAQYQGLFLFAAIASGAMRSIAWTDKSIINFTTGARNVPWGCDFGLTSGNTGGNYMGCSYTGDSAALASGPADARILTRYVDRTKPDAPQWAAQLYRVTKNFGLAADSSIGFAGADKVDSTTGGTWWAISKRCAEGQVDVDGVEYSCPEWAAKVIKWMVSGPVGSKFLWANRAAIPNAVARPGLPAVDGPDPYYDKFFVNNSSPQHPSVSRVMVDHHNGIKAGTYYPGRPSYHPCLVTARNKFVQLLNTYATFRPSATETDPLVGNLSNTAGIQDAVIAKLQTAVADMLTDPNAKCR
jgi:hypothetical protein